MIWIQVTIIQILQTKLIGNYRILSYDPGNNNRLYRSIGNMNTLEFDNNEALIQRITGIIRMNLTEQFITNSNEPFEYRIIGRQVVPE